MEILVQLADFFLKAGVLYLSTSQGQKELDDIEKAVGNVVGDFMSQAIATENVDLDAQSVQSQTPRPPRDFKKPQRIGR